MVTSLPIKSIPLLTLERSFYLYSRATLSRTGKMIPLEFVKGILTEFKKYKISSKALDFVFFVIPQVIVVVVGLPYILHSVENINVYVEINHFKVSRFHDNDKSEKKTFFFLPFQKLFLSKYQNI